MTFAIFATVAVVCAGLLLCDLLRRVPIVGRLLDVLFGEVPE